MRSEFVIGVDIGTQGTKAALFAAEGKRLATAFVKSRLYQPGIGMVEEDPERQVASVCATIIRCMRSSGIGAGDVAAIGIDGQMAGVIGIGRDGRALTPYDSWLDTRCARCIGKMENIAGDEIVVKTGAPPSFNHGPKILRWKNEFPKIYRSIRAFVQPGGYAVMRLCGLDGAAAFIDKTYLHFSGFADNRRARWDEGLCRRFGIDAAKLPRIVDAHAVMGTLCGSMARRCGLRSGIPVIAGCGDTAASFLACGAVRPGVCVDVAGTASVFAATTGTFRADRRRRTLSCGQSAAPGLWHPYAYINGGGMNLEWFRNNFASALGRRCAPLDFKALERLAARISPSADMPLFIPHLAGRVSPSRPYLRGAWVGLAWKHGLGQLYRSVLEGVALEYGLYVKILRELHPNLGLRELRVTGGGSASALWNQIKADILGTRVVPAVRREGASMGVALLAAYGAGLCPDLAAAADRWVRLGAGVLPVRRRAKMCAARVERYKNILAALTDWSAQN